MLSIFVIGRVAKAADIRKDAKGKPYAIVEITTYRTYKNTEGERIIDTVPVKLYGKQVELFQRFAYPGSQIAVLGNFEPSPFEDSSSAYSFLIKARHLEFLSYKKQDASAQAPVNEVTEDAAA